jgi:hypothetical protein
MTGSATPAELREAFVRRLDAVLGQLHAHAASGPLAGLTEPDEPGGEQWEQSDVWAHLAEIIGYWVPQVRKVAAEGTSEPAPFGRTKKDAGRVGYITSHRDEPVATHVARLDASASELRALLLDLPDEAWSASGLHETRGVMSMFRIVDEFAVGHLEEHEEQLAGLAAAKG